MTCGGCRSTVEKALNSIDGIEATVSLDPPVASITMEKHIPTEQLQESLTAVGNYTIEISKPFDATEKALEEPIAKSCCGTKMD